MYEMANTLKGNTNFKDNTFWLHSLNCCQRQIFKKPMYELPLIARKLSYESYLLLQFFYEMYYMYF